MKRQETNHRNRIEINLLTHKKQESPLFVDDETLDISATVLANMMLDFVRANGTEKLTPSNPNSKQKYPWKRQEV